MRAGRGRPAVGVVGRAAVRVRVLVWVGPRQVHVVLGHVALRHAEAIGGHVGHRRQMHGLGARG